jgi:hypothetical protein
MPSRRSCVALLVLVVIAGTIAWLPVAALPLAEGQQGPVRLAVLVVFDQMRGDYLGRWGEHFREGGFHRLMHDGAWFQECRYPYAGTETGPGHASLATGCAPWQHGIVLNNWYDRDEGTEVYCAGSERYERVPPSPKRPNDEPGASAPGATPGKKRKITGIGAPVRLLAPTIADALKQATGGRGRVVALSFKDRSCVLPGGQKPDACYWLDVKTGQFITSTFYRDRLHPWVEAFNKERPADRWFGKDWERFRADLDYEKLSGPDDARGEGKGAAQGVTFPHPMTGGEKTLGPKYYEALYNSPFGNELLLDLVKRAIDAEKLGTHDAPDLLVVSFSCNDPVGHCWGPDSQEVLDVTLRSDRIVRELLDKLDASVGKGKYVLALSADHGVCPLPEQSSAKGIAARRISPTLLQKEAEAFLQETFGKGETGSARAIAALEDGCFYLDRAWVKAHGLEQGKVEEALAGWLVKQPGMKAAWTRTQLLKGMPEDEMGQRVRRSFHPERSGDVVFAPQPYCLVTGYLTGTSHGTPHPYDTHVPLLVYGGGVRPGVRRDPVTPQAAAAILAHGVGIAPPAKAEYPVPEGLFTDSGKGSK